MMLSPLKAWRRSAARSRRHGLALLPAITLPFPEDQARSTVARYQRTVAALSRNIDEVVATATSGALTPVEALAVVRRHVKRLRFDLAALDSEMQS